MACLLLIGTIITMILVSVHPYEPKKIFLLLAAVIFFAVYPCLAQPVMMDVAATPYDRQMSRIQPILNSTGESAKEAVSLSLVNQWIQGLRGIPYGFSAQWKTPSEVATDPVADCKGKAVALYQKMQSHGAHNVRLVIGKRTPMSRKTHAWLEWNTRGDTYVLDPTINWAACRTNDLAGDNYRPLYAYSGTRKYRAVEAPLLARN